MFSFFLLYLFGWHWFTKPYRFQVDNSMKHHLCTASCAHCPKQSLFLSPFSPTLPTSTYHLSPFPSDHHHTVSVSIYYMYFMFFVFNHLTFFHLAHQPPPLWQLSVCSMYPCLYFYFVCHFILFIRLCSHLLTFQFHIDKLYVYVCINRNEMNICILHIYTYTYIKCIYVNIHI